MDDKFSSEPRRRTAPDLVRVLSEPEAVEALGLSRRTWDRLKSIGDVPAKTRLSEGRVGYRVCDIAAWLDARREAPTTRDMVDSFRPIGEVANAVAAKVRS
jgi:predicted DNA-binding transcriptional regulator AlpA